jgi:hypothetical protein
MGHMLTRSNDLDLDRTKQVMHEQSAARWLMSPWQWLGKGRRVLYREEDAEAWETAQICQNTLGPLPVEGP